jgi:CO/xanthine dehydrogenase FAD-binding subunit
VAALGLHVARALCSVAWRPSPGGRKWKAMLVGQRITPELAAQAGEASVEGAHPLAKNKYKVPLTKAVVKRTLLSLTA